MAQKPPKLPTAEVVANIRKQVATGSREPFADILATALAVPPSRTAFRSLARQNPRQYVQTLKDLAELNGYATRSERIEVKHDARSMALELVNRVGADRARQILQDFGLPASLIPAQTQPDAIDGEIVERTGGKSGESTDASERSTDTDREKD